VSMVRCPRAEPGYSDSEYDLRLIPDCPACALSVLSPGLISAGLTYCHAHATPSARASTPTPTSLAFISSMVQSKARDFQRLLGWYRDGSTVGHLRYSLLLLLPDVAPSYARTWHATGAGGDLVSVLEHRRRVGRVELRSRIRRISCERMG